MNPFGPVNATFRNLATGHGLSTSRAGPPVRDDEHVVGGLVHQLLEQQGLLPVLAAADGYPGGGDGRQPEHDGRSRLDVAVPDAGLPRLAVRLQLLLGRDDARRQGVLRDQRRRVRHHERERHPELHPVHGLRPRRDRRSHPHRLPLPAAPTSSARSSARRPPGGWTGTSSAPSTTDRHWSRPPARWGGRGSLAAQPRGGELRRVARPISRYGPTRSARPPRRRSGQASRGS